MANLNPETVDIINGKGFNPFGKLQSPDEILRVLGYLNETNNAFGANDGMINWYQLLLQQSNREIDWERTNPQSVAQQLQMAGMSRSAALQAASGQQGVTSAISPADPAHPDISPAVQAASTAASIVSTAASLYSSLSSLPYDKRVKKATADLISNQGKMLSEQMEGSRLAASFYQDAVNNGFDFKGKNAGDVLMFLSDLGTDVAAFKSNPYAMSQLSSMLTQEYGAAADSYSAESAANMQRIQVATEGLIKGQSLGQQFMNRHLWRQDDIELACHELSKSASIAQAAAADYKMRFDAARFEKFYENVNQFTMLDLYQLDYDISQLQYKKDLKLWQYETRALVNSYKYQAAQYLFAFNLQNDIAREYEKFADRDELGVPQNDKFSGLLNRMVLYNTLDKQGETDNTFRWLKFGAGTAAGLGAGALAAAKWLVPLVQGAKTASAAAATAANAAATAAPSAEGFFGAPLNITAPFIVNRHALELMFNPLYNPMLQGGRIDPI